MIQEQYTDLAGKIRILWQTNSGNVFSYKFDSQPTEEELTSLGEISENELILAAIQPLDLGVTDSFNIVAPTIERIKAASEINFDSYTQYMSSLDWPVQSTLKLFMFNLVSKLTNNESISEEDGFILTKDYIQSKTNSELERLFNIKL